MTDLDLVRELEIIRTGLMSAAQVMRQATDTIAELTAQNAMMRQALADIREGRGAFSPDLCVCGHEWRLHGLEADGTRGLCIRDEWCQCPGFQPYHDDYEECRRLAEAGKP